MPWLSQEEGEVVGALWARGAHAHAVSLDSGASDVVGSVWLDLAGHIAAGHAVNEGAGQIDGGAAAAAAEQPAAARALLLAKLQLANRKGAATRGSAPQDDGVGGAGDDGRSTGSGDGELKGYGGQAAPAWPAFGCSTCRCAMLRVHKSSMPAAAGTKL